MFAISIEAIDVPALREKLESLSSGACVTFEGRVRNRNEGREVVRMEYEAYEAVATAEGQKILEEARQKFGLERAVSVHREGSLELGDLAVWVGVSAPHRAEAFDGCRFIIDEIKRRLPIWKKEYYADGESGWVNCTTESPSQEKTG